MDISFQIPRATLIWILLCVVLVILPHTARLPILISAIAVGCIVWRLLIHMGKLNHPGRFIRGVVVAGALVVAISQLRDLGIGLDSAAGLLALCFVCKLVEMQNKRDIYVVISLCFVMAMVAFLYSQSVLMTLYIVVVVTTITAAMISLNRSSMIRDNVGTAGMAIKIVLQALPLTVVLFAVFPRIAPLWAVPIQTGINTTGVSDEMSPGDISQLGRSSRLAFRVQFEGSAPPLHADLYWRGLVLDDFDGETWRRANASNYVMASSLPDFRRSWEGRITTDNNPVFYNVILEPTQRPWIYGLHLAEPQSNEFFKSRNFELFNSGPITQRLSYNLISYTNNQTDLIILGGIRRRNLRLPEEGNQLSRDFARQLRATVASDRDFAFAVLAYFQQNEFFYSLNPALLGEDRIDDFLFNTLEGFCEHYASTFAFLMRAVGIPTRVVVGYQGAEYNPFENYMMIYQYNAHAWNEVWLDGEGWVRFDPTGAVSPERIALGVEEALRDDPAFMEDGLFSAAMRSNFSWLNSIRLRLDAIEYGWNKRVVNYDEDAQLEFFEQIFGEVTDQKVLFLLIGLTSIALTAIAFTIIKIEPKSKRDPLDRFYLKVCKELAKINLGRRAGEGPNDYCNRVSEARPELRAAMHEITELYVQLCYAEKSPSSEQLRVELKRLRVPFSRLAKGRS